MGITVSNPSQIPVNVVEIGDEISQDAINAISSAGTPSTGNPFSTASAVTTAISTYLPLVGGTLTGAITVTAINSGLNADITFDTYNDTGAGTHFVHSFDAFTGTLDLATNGGGLTFPDTTVQTTAALPFTGGNLTGSIAVGTGGFTTTISGPSIGFDGGLVINQEEAHITGFNINLPASGTITSCGSITFSDSTVQTTAAVAGVNLGDVFSISNVQSVTFSGTSPSPCELTITFRPVNTYINQSMTLVVENADGSISQNVKGSVSSTSNWTYVTTYDTFPADQYIYMVANGVKATIPINFP